MREIIENQYTTPKIAHLAGIVPIAGKALDFQMPWPDAMMPIAPNYIAAERAILECAWAGCETIWVVCNQDIARVIKNKIGEFVYDPVRSYFKHKMPDGHIKTMFKKIPIYYVPVFTKNRAKLSLPYSVIQGAYNAYHASWVLSKWMLPAMYYVAFPYGVYSPKLVSKNRERLSTYVNHLITNKEGKSILDGEYLGFTFSRQQYKEFRNVITKKKVNKDWIDYELDDVFNRVIVTEYEPIKINNYHNISNWDGYCKFLGSDQTKYYTTNTINKYFVDKPFTLYGMVEEPEEEEQDGDV
jgi:hypothetical protein